MALPSFEARPVADRASQASLLDSSWRRISSLEKLRRPMLARVVPFGLYLLFLFVAQCVDVLADAMALNQESKISLQLWLYPVKTLAVLAALVLYWPSYEELRGPWFPTWRQMVLAGLTGLLVYLAWIKMAWPWATQGQASGYNPFQANDGLGTMLAGIRLFGGVVVVPIMEELFWRSFLLRYLISRQFQSVPLGAFTLASCAVTVLLFGVEHDLWLAGMVAGLAYTLLLYRTRNLWTCIAAHASTNLLLGIHVLTTGEWHWW